MYILILTKIDPRGRVYWSTVRHSDDSAVTFHTEQDAEREGNRILNRKGARITWFDVQKIG